MALADASFEVNILPSAVMDIVRGRYFYDQFELGLGQRFRDYVVGEIDCRVVTVWRVLDQRFDPHRVDACLRDPDCQG